MCGRWFLKVLPSFVFLETRKDEVCSIRSKFPNKLPVSCFFPVKHDAFDRQCSWCCVSWRLIPCVFFVFRWLLNVTRVKRLSPSWTKQSSWSPSSSPWVSSCACSGKLLTAFLPSFSPPSPPSCWIHPHPHFVFLLGIRLTSTPPRLCSSWWQRRACPACPPAWGKFIPATETLTASCTSPTPRKRCSEHLDQKPVRPAEPEADKMNSGPKRGQTEPSPGCFYPFFLFLPQTAYQPTSWSLKHITSFLPSFVLSRLALTMSLFWTDRWVFFSVAPKTESKTSKLWFYPPVTCLYRLKIPTFALQLPQKCWASMQTILLSRRCNASSVSNHQNGVNVSPVIRLLLSTYLPFPLSSLLSDGLFILVFPL